MKKRSVSRTMNVRWMTAASMMMALTVVLANTPLGLIRLPFLTATTLHIPVIIAVLTLGWQAGVITGLTFGVCSWLSNLTGASFFAPFFVNPLVSVLPRLLFPLAVYALDRLLTRATQRFDRRRMIARFGASAIGTALHTAMVMGMIYLLYRDQIALLITQGAGVPQALAQQGVGKGVAALGVANGIPEMIVACVIAPAVSLALDQVLGRGNIRK